MKTDDSSNNNVDRIYWREPLFAAALLAGPFCWFVLWVLGQPLVGPPSLTLLVQLILLMPILEEIVFRGGIQAWLYARSPFSKQWLGISLANLVTSILFASLHLISQPPMWAAMVFLPSLVFGWARDRFNSVVPGTVLHAVYNAGFVWLFVPPTA